MMFNTADSARYAPSADAIGPSLANWLKRSFRHLADRRSPAPQTARDRAREAAEVRDWAATLQRSDPAFAADLIAAADRHERDMR